MTTPKLSAEQKKTANEILGRLDTSAQYIQANHEAWGLDFDTAKQVVNKLDEAADAFERAIYGSDSLQRRQAEILKEAKVLQQDADESYMAAFEVDQGVVQQDADEPYMAAYSDDQSSAVGTATDATGRRLAPSY